MGVYDIYQSSLIDEDSPDVSVGHVGPDEQKDVITVGPSGELLSIKVKGDEPSLTVSMVEFFFELALMSSLNFLLTNPTVTLVNPHLDMIMAGRKASQGMCNVK